MTPIDNKTTPSVRVQAVSAASEPRGAKIRFDATTGLTAVKSVATITWKAWRMCWGHERRADAMEDKLGAWKISMSDFSCEGRA